MGTSNVFTNNKHDVLLTRVDALIVNGVAHAQKQMNHTLH